MFISLPGINGVLRILFTHIFFLFHLSLLFVMGALNPFCLSSFPLRSCRAWRMCYCRVSFSHDMFSVLSNEANGFVAK